MEEDISPEAIAQARKEAAEQFDKRTKALAVDLQQSVLRAADSVARWVANNPGTPDAGPKIAALAQLVQTDFVLRLLPPIEDPE